MREKPRNDAGKQISAAAFGHRGISRGVDGYAAIRVGDKRPRTFEYQRNPVAFGEAARDLKAIGLHIADRNTGQPSHLARMRSEHQRPSLGKLRKQHRFGGQNVQRVGIDNCWNFGCREQAGDELDCVRALAQAGTDGQHGLACHEHRREFPEQDSPRRFAHPRWP